MGLGPKAIESKSNNKPSISKGIYNKILDERMNETLKMSREISFNYLIHRFKGPSPSISFIEFESPMYTYNQLKNGDKMFLEDDQRKFRSELGQITSGYRKSENQ